MVQYQKHLNKHLSYNLVHNLHPQLFVINLPHLYHLNQQVVELLLYVNNLIVLNNHHRLVHLKHLQEQNHLFHQFLLIMLYDQQLHQSKKLHQYRQQFSNLKKHRNRLNRFRNFIFLVDN
jgi:hypothetical protein